MSVFKCEAKKLKRRMVMFFDFCQNNSYGYFVVDEKVCHRLFIEADNED